MVERFAPKPPDVARTRAARRRYGNPGGRAQASGATHTVVEFAVRPYRHGLLVPAEDPDRLVAAFRMAAEHWGGTAWPVLAVGPDDVVAPQWVDIARAVGIDDLVDLTPDDRGARWAAQRGGAGWPVRRPNAGEPLAPAARNPVAYPPHLARRADLVLPAADDPVTLAGAGGFADATAAQPWRAVGARLDSGADRSTSALAQLLGLTLTGAGTPSWVADLSDPPPAHTLGLVWVAAEPASALDALWFWNLRALRDRGLSRAVSVLTTPDVARGAAFQEALAAALRETAVTDPQCLLLSSSVSTTDLEDLAAALGFQFFPGTLADDSPPRLVSGLDASLRCAVGVDPRAWWSGPAPTAPSRQVLANVAEGRAELATTSPLTFHPRLAGHGEVVVHLSGGQIAGPRRPAVARLFHPDASWNSTGLQLVSVPLNRYAIPLQFPDPASVLRAALAESVGGYETSEVGRRVDGLLDGVEEPRLFRRPEFHDLVHGLAAEGLGLSRAMRVEELATLGGVVHTPAGRWETAGVLDQLAREGLVQRGLVVGCGTCAAREFRALGELTDDGPNCGHCAGPAHYLANDDGQPAFHYRPDEALAGVVQGVTPIVLAANALLRAEGAYVSSFVQLYVAGSWTWFDLVGWQQETLFAGFAVDARASAPGGLQARIAACVAARVDLVVVVSLDRLDSHWCDELAQLCEREGLGLSILDGPELLVPRAVVDLRDAPAAARPAPAIGT